MNTAYSQYKKNSVFTSTPEELTLMVYNGLVKFIMQGINSIEGENIEKANKCITKAQNIVFELQASLDGRYEVAQGLDSLYDYMHRRLVEANIDKDKDILEEVLGFAKDLRDTWQEAMKTAKIQNRRKKVVSNE